MTMKRDPHRLGAIERGLVAQEEPFLSTSDPGRNGSTVVAMSEPSQRLSS